MQIQHGVASLEHDLSYLDPARLAVFTASTRLAMRTPRYFGVQVIPLNETVMFIGGWRCVAGAI
jgi:hypothetical protein